MDLVLSKIPPIQTANKRSIYTYLAEVSYLKIPWGGHSCLKCGVICNILTDKICGNVSFSGYNLTSPIVHLSLVHYNKTLNYYSGLSKIKQVVFLKEKKITSFISDYRGDGTN